MATLNKSDAKLAFFLSFGSLIPYLNYFLSPIAIFIAVSAIRKIRHHPDIYGGMRYAIIAIVLSGIALILSILGLILW
ncbi:MAG TPA: hypothetical protein VK158_05810 [Acidobacteriota bacterium]|nr:hypothetical protein [Acidobacteriota bacterium]